MFTTDLSAYQAFNRSLNMLIIQAIYLAEFPAKKFTTNLNNMWSKLTQCKMWSKLTFLHSPVKVLK